MKIIYRDQVNIDRVREEIDARIQEIVNSSKGMTVIEVKDMVDNDSILIRLNQMLLNLHLMGAIDVIEMTNEELKKVHIVK